MLTQLVVGLVLFAFGAAVAAAVLYGARRWLPKHNWMRLRLDKLGILQGSDAVLAVLFVVGGLVLTLYYS